MLWFYFEKWLSYQMLPPAIICNLLLAGLICFGLRRRRLGCGLIFFATICFYLLSLPIISQHLTNTLQGPPLSASQIKHPQVQAIVVLSGGNNYLAPEYGSVQISNTNLTRLRYAAYLAQKTQLPILISGASIGSNLPAAAQTMANTLEQLWKIKARWIESRSKNTEQNATLSAAILKQHHIKRIWLVTSASHMPRASLSFQHQGLQVTAAPTDYIRSLELHHGIFNWTPRAAAFMRSYLACYEYIGLLWYRWHKWD